MHGQHGAMLQLIILIKGSRYVIIWTAKLNNPLKDFLLRSVVSVPAQQSEKSSFSLRPRAHFVPSLLTALFQAGTVKAMIIRNNSA